MRAGAPTKSEAAFSAGRRAEREDQLAYLAWRKANADRVAASNDPLNSDWARDRARQLEVIAGDVLAGMHVGLAEMMEGLNATSLDNAKPAGMEPQATLVQASPSAERRTA